VLWSSRKAGTPVVLVCLTLFPDVTQSMLIAAPNRLTATECDGRRENMFPETTAGTLSLMEPDECSARSMRLSDFVAYVDESGSGGPVFVVGSLLAKPDQWSLFVDCWQGVLAAPPAIPDFHLTESHGLSPESYQQKIETLIGVINAYVLRGDLVVIHAEQYKAIFAKKIGITRDTPEFQGYITIMAQVASYMKTVEEKIEFIFDYIDDTHFLEVLEAHRKFKEICPFPAVREKFGSDPIRGDDKLLLPLQAADLWTGLMRRSYEGDKPAQSLLKKIDITNTCMVFDEPTLLKHWNGSVSQIPDLALRLELGVFYEPRKQRSARLASARKRLKSTPG
jgi:Protein of unknown function (DUF3800)